MTAQKQYKGEVTPEMIDAGIGELVDYDPGWDCPGEMVARIYRAMRVAELPSRKGRDRSIWLRSWAGAIFCLAIVVSSIAGQAEGSAFHQLRGTKPQGVPITQYVIINNKAHDVSSSGRGLHSRIGHFIGQGEKKYVSDYGSYGNSSDDPVRNSPPFKRRLFVGGGSLVITWLIAYWGWSIFDSNRLAGMAILAIGFLVGLGGMGLFVLSNARWTWDWVL